MAGRKVSLIDLLRSRFPQKTEKELRAAVLRGHVTVEEEVVWKAGTPVAPGASLRLRPSPAYVSRGGEKLAAALAAWAIDCTGSAWIDAGCSTGGFTDCLLKHGAPLVFAVDVGEGQLDWRLRTDSRVRTMERTNIMSLARLDLDPLPGRAVADLSFRSLQGAARHILGLTSEGWGIFLVKPQFELGQGHQPEGFRGVVRDPEVTRGVVRDLVQRLSTEGVAVRKAIASPIAGRRGNREFLFLLDMAAGAPPDTEAAISGLFAE
jgi:23S rRNA (cytidine1920-2'-O)/16S rRNA (cytidine1409-2'-O)-methyltransferase